MTLILKSLYKNTAKCSHCIRISIHLKHQAPGPHTKQLNICTMILALKSSKEDAGKPLLPAAVPDSPVFTYQPVDERRHGFSPEVLLQGRRQTHVHNIVPPSSRHSRPRSYQSSHMPVKYALFPVSHDGKLLNYTPDSFQGYHDRTPSPLPISRSQTQRHHTVSPTSRDGQEWNQL